MPGEKSTSMSICTWDKDFLHKGHHKSWTINVNCGLKLVRFDCPGVLMVLAFGEVSNLVPTKVGVVFFFWVEEHRTRLDGPVCNMRR